MKEKIYSIGIDVSKQTLDVCFLGEKFKALKEFKIQNSNQGIQNLLQYFEDYSLDKDASIVLESTSSYHVLSTLLLQENGFKVKVFNPIISAKYAKASIRKCKTDKLDAKRIAEIGILEEIPEANLSKSDFSLKRKVSTLQTLNKQKQVMNASLRQIKEDCQNLGIKIGSAYEELESTLKSLKKTIRKLEKEICEEAKNLKGFENVSEISGVSKKVSRNHSEPIT